MKRPNKLLKKKYVSSLVIAAFLILSVLTAYNIKIGNKETGSANTKVEETMEQDNVNDTEDALSYNSRNTQTTDQDDTDNEEQAKNQEETDDLVKGQTSSQENQEETEEQETEHTTDRLAQSDYSYDGETKLTWPVLGNVILPYSMDTTVYYTTLDQYACNDGVLISAKTGDEVVAAADGRVVNISESDRYGKTMTVLIGEYYEVYYSQIDNMKYNIGDDIKEGEVIATVAEPTRAFTLEGAHVFFKMTYKGDPVNPTDYLRN